MKYIKTCVISLLIILISCNYNKELPDLSLAIQKEKNSIIYKEGVSYFRISNELPISHIETFDFYLKEYSSSENQDTIDHYKKKIDREIYYCGPYGYSMQVFFDMTEDYRTDPEKFNFMMDVVKLLYYKSFINAELGLTSGLDAHIMRYNYNKAKDTLEISLGAYNYLNPGFITICRDTIYENTQGIIKIKTDVIKKSLCPVKYYYKGSGYYNSFDINL